MAGTHLAPPPPSTSAMALPVSTRARREKSEWRSGGLWKTRSYISACRAGHGEGWAECTGLGARPRALSRACPRCRHRGAQALPEGAFRRATR